MAEQNSCKMDALFVAADSVETKLFTLCHFDEFSGELDAFPTRIACSPQDYVIDILINSRRDSKIFKNFLYCLAEIYDPSRLSFIKYNPDTHVVSFQREGSTIEVVIGDVINKLATVDGFWDGDFNGQILAWRLIEDPISEPCRHY